MALADIIGRIESDAGAEARALTDGATAKAEAIMAEAKREGERYREHALHDTRRDAESRAATLLANARLAARDELLAGKRTLVERALRQAEERLAAFDDATYTRVIASGIIRTARGGDVVRVAEADRKRLAGLRAAVDAAAAEAGCTLDLVFSDTAADISHGVTLKADRVSAEVSPDSMVSGRHDELMAVATAGLFPAEEA
ncbi:MAG: V-type ATP synthase subunit E family protein [Coriobacteriia bacterium]|nr:V-type ATP synthase subunit E family protein [Coriobacteriia bacterium]